MRPKITTHTIVKNEDRGIWYAIRSVIDHVDRMIIYDTGSTDSTVSQIKSFTSSKIIFRQKKATTRDQLVELRREQLKHTTTPWFMLLDGDEIWPQDNLRNLISAATAADKNSLAFFTRTRNCVGDIFHYLPESKGRYHIKGKTGHLNIRLIRNSSHIKVTGSYPLETYSYKNTPLQDLGRGIEFIDTWYLHLSHLPRSTNKAAEAQVIDRLNKRKFRFGIRLKQQDIPEVFLRPRPKNIPPPIINRWVQLIKGGLSL